MTEFEFMRQIITFLIKNGQLEMLEIVLSMPNVNLYDTGKGKTKGSTVSYFCNIFDNDMSYE